MEILSYTEACTLQKERQIGRSQRLLWLHHTFPLIEVQDDNIRVTNSGAPKKTRENFGTQKQKHI